MSPDSGVSSLRAPTSSASEAGNGNNDRSGSRSSTLSSSDDSLKAVKASMGDRQPTGSASSSAARPPSAPRPSGTSSGWNPSLCVEKGFYADVSWESRWNFEINV